MALLPPDMVLHVKGSLNLKYHNVFLKEHSVFFQNIFQKFVRCFDFLLVTRLGKNSSCIHYVTELS